MYVLVVRLRTRPPLLLQGGGRVRKGASQHIHDGLEIECLSVDLLTSPCCRTGPRAMCASIKIVRVSMQNNDFLAYLFT